MTDFLSEIHRRVYQCVKCDRADVFREGRSLGISEGTVKRTIAELERFDYIDARHFKIKGEWRRRK